MTVLEEMRRMVDREPASDGVLPIHAIFARQFRPQRGRWRWRQQNARQVTPAFVRYRRTVDVIARLTHASTPPLCLREEMPRMSASPPCFLSAVCAARGRQVG